MKLATALIVAASIAALALIGAAPVRAQSLRAEIEAIVKNYLAEHPEDVQRIVKDYLAKNPDALKDALNELVKSRQAANANDVDKSAAIKANAKLLFGSTRQVTLGNPAGDVTVVEFFDYNCGYCKRALGDMMTLIKDDPKLRFVLKEFPILGPGSAEAARVAVAVRMQDASGEKYLAFHQKMLSDRGSANKATALAAAKDAGLDVVRIETDMQSEEAGKTIEESTMLARVLGIGGTPGYVIGDSVVPGAIGAVALKDKIRAARK